MQLTLSGIQDPTPWEKAGIRLPGYDAAAAQRLAVEAPRWVHFGIGNIFRVFLGGIADGLLEQGLLDRGITCVETFDYEVVDKIYTPFDNLGIRVILEPDGTREIRVIGSLAEAVRADCADAAQWARLKTIFTAPSLQIVSFTITEKGYALYDTDGSWLPGALADLNGGPERARTAMGIVTAMLHARYLAGGCPVALVSMDNIAKNGVLLSQAVNTIARQWQELGFVPAAFVEWLGQQVAFNSTMIDKITPRPSDQIAADLAQLGVADMEPVITAKRTYIAPFVNAERPQYLVIEDRFPNGRPALEAGEGVFLGDFDTVCRAERMKVTALLNPAHTAVGPLGVVLGQERFADMLRDIPVTLKMAKQVVYGEGMTYVPDPGVLRPADFADEVFRRFTNLYLGDTNLRLATDASQGLAVRFGETVKAYTVHRGSAADLTAIPLGIAAYFRYLLAVDDLGRPYELAPDPLADYLHAALSDIRLGHPETYHGQLQPLLRSTTLFGTDLVTSGLGDKIETMFRKMISGFGATLKTVEEYVG